MTNIPAEFIERARTLLAAQCKEQGFKIRANNYSAGHNDEQPELIALARVLRDITPRPLHELLAEDEEAARI